MHLTGRCLHKLNQPRNSSSTLGTVGNDSSDYIFPIFPNLIPDKHRDTIELFSSKLNNSKSNQQNSKKTSSLEQSFNQLTTISINFDSLPDNSRRLPHIMQSFISRAIMQASNEPACISASSLSQNIHKCDHENDSPQLTNFPISAPPPTPNCFALMNFVNKSDQLYSDTYKRQPIFTTPTANFDSTYGLSSHNQPKIEKITVKIPHSTARTTY